MAEHRLIGIGGIAPDPYSGDPAVARLRQLVVDAGFRRRGVARNIVYGAMELAENQYRSINLRIPAIGEAAPFYERLGFQRVENDPDRTHFLMLNAAFPAISSLSPQQVSFNP